MRKQTLSRLCTRLPWPCAAVLIPVLLLSAPAPAPAVTRADMGTVIRLPDDTFRVPKAFTYEVKKDDNLHWLAAKFYGDPRLWVRIYESNRATLQNPNVLRIGQQLSIPPSP